MNVVRRFGYPVLVALMIMGMSCGSGGPVIEVVNGGAPGGWPDGTVLMVFRDGEVAGRSVLYGGHTRITLHREGVYRLRAGVQSHLAAVTEPFTVGAGITMIDLPEPVERRRIEGRTLGLSLVGAVVPALPGDFRDDDYRHLTTLTVPAASVSTIDGGIHRRLAECIARVTISPEQAGMHEDMAAAMLDTLALAGADGVVIDTGDNTVNGWSDIIRVFASGAHERGMTVAVEVGTVPPDDWNVADVRETERPDEVRLPIPMEASAGDMQLAADRLDRYEAAGIPPDAVTVVVSMTARASGTVTGEEIAPAPGVLDSLITISGGGIMRLRDGTCRFGYGGVVYRFNDSAGLADKISRLRELTGSRIGGVHIVWDGTGVNLDGDGLDTIIVAMTGRID